MSVSIQQAQEIHSIFIEIYGILTNISIATRQIEQKAPTINRHISQLREIEYILFRVTASLQMLGLPKNINHAIELMQKLILMARMAQFTIRMLQATTTFGLSEILNLGMMTFAMGTTMAMTGYDILTYDSIRGIEE